jgi:hypothetical protein
MKWEFVHKNFLLEIEEKGEDENMTLLGDNGFNRRVSQSQTRCTSKTAGNGGSFRVRSFFKVCCTVFHNKKKSIELS